MKEHEINPIEIQGLVDTAIIYASTILQKFEEPNCPRLNELYKVKSGKTYRIADKFNRLNYSPSPDQSHLEEGKTKNEFKGLYIFGEEVNEFVNPVYVGISRTVYRRLRQHGWGKKQNECSLAYLKARSDDDMLTRGKVDNKLHLEPKKKIIQSYKVVLIPVQKDYDLYFLEVAIAGILKTKWNSFRTH
jgi:hypothetical protein